MLLTASQRQLWSKTVDVSNKRRFWSKAIVVSNLDSFGGPSESCRCDAHRQFWSKTVDVTKKRRFWSKAVLSSRPCRTLICPRRRKWSGLAAHEVVDLSLDSGALPSSSSAPASAVPAEEDYLSGCADSDDEYGYDGRYGHFSG